MATKYDHTINGVQFSIEDNAPYNFPKIQNQSGDIESGDISPLINAVEIDWNGNW